MSEKVTRRQFLGRSGALLGGASIGPGLLTACGGGQGAQDGGPEPFRAGAVLELSGAFATGGQIARRGYKFWADTINQQGGIEINGTKHPVELIIQDCQSKPQVGADAVARLITQENVDVMFGSYTSNVQLAMNPICAKYQVPCIAGSSESPKNWVRHPQFTYGIIPSVDLTAGQSIQFIAESADPRPSTAAVVGVNEPFSKATAIGFREGARNTGLQITEYTLFPPKADLTPIATTVASGQPDLVAVGGHDVLLVDFVNALKGAQFTPKAIIEHYGITDPSFSKALQQDANGVLGLSVWLPDAPYKDDLFGTASEYAKKYKNKYGVAADYTTAGCSAAGEVFQLAAQKLGKAPSLSKQSRLKLNQILARTNITTFYGKINFADSGDHFHCNTALDPFLVQVQDGGIVAVAPEEARDANMIYPMTPWSKRD